MVTLLFFIRIVVEVFGMRHYYCIRNINQQQSSMNSKSIIKKTFVSLFLTVLFFVSCNERIHEITDVTDTALPVSFSVSALDQIPFSAVLTRAEGITSCSMITFDVFACDSVTRLVHVNQDISDPNFGSFNVKLEEGRYILMVIAHNGDVHPTTTKLKQIEFKSNKTTQKMTDTFLYCSEIEVSSSQTNFELSLSRIVAQFQLSLTDTELPSDFTQIKFYYLGGSNTLDATTGFGCVNSKQTEYVTVLPGVKEYGVYTFLRPESDKLSMTITAMAGTVPMKEIKLDDVPITKNYITKYTGEMFAKPMAETMFSISVQDGWAGTGNHSF